jgi:hypothetical protein
VDLVEIVCNDMDWTDLVQDGKRLLDLVNKVISILIPLMENS